MPITGPRAEAIKKEIKLIQSGAMRGDFMQSRDRGRRGGISQAEQRMVQNLSLKLMTTEERAAHDKRVAAGKLEAARAKALRNTFQYTKLETLTKDKTNANIEKLRALTLDDANPDQWLLFHRAIPMMYHRGQVLGKFRFNWGANGKPVYVPWTKQSWENFFRHAQRGRWIPNQPFMHKCDENWETHWINKYFAESQNQARYGKYQAPGDKRKVWQHTIGAAICKKKKKSLWVKIRKGVVGAAVVVAAVYLGPVIVAKVKAVAGGAGAGAAGGGGTAAGTAATAATGTAATTATSAVAQATTFQKIQAGTKTLLGYVNKARTVKAIASGKLPPPPISIAGSSFRNWAMIVAKEKIKDEAMEAAMEAGQKYIAKKMTQKQEAELRAEIAELQKQIIAATPKEVIEMPPEPDPQLAEPIKKIQVIEVERAHELDKFIIPGAIVAGALLLGG